MHDVVIIVNGPFYVLHALTLYEQLASQKHVSIVVTYVKSIHTYLESLNLTLRTLVFYDTSSIPEIRLKHPLQARQIVAQARQRCRPLVNRFQDAEVYYSGDQVDLVELMLIMGLRRRNRIVNFGLPPYKIVRDQPANLQESIYLRFMRYLTGAHYYYGSIEGSPLNAHYALFDSRACGISEQVFDYDPAVLRKYCYRPPSRPIAPSVLFMENDLGGMFYDYQQTTEAIIRELMAIGCSIHIKPHPRLGYSKFLDNLPVTILPAEIPCQLMTYSFDVAMAVGCTSMVDFLLLGRPVFALDRIYRYQNLDEGGYFVEYLAKEPRLQKAGVTVPLPATVAELCRAVQATALQPR